MKTVVYVFRFNNSVHVYQYVIVEINSSGIIESICKLHLDVYIGFRALIRKRLSKKLILSKQLKYKKKGNDNKKESLREIVDLLYPCSSYSDRDKLICFIMKYEV